MDYCSNQPPVVHFEHYRSGAFLLDETDVTDYLTGVETVVEKAMNPIDSAGFIAEVINRLEKQ
ncbi:Scr1 family TA system antitoxin-like transcriptional regulator [Actinokineospora sp.]|uniref:Scr1 family TA system antitoxin-like transcriptional regulator n=1 Tax=Actinokineospora sp. TaxID=1872133 RepID=UPI003D6AE2E5